MINEFVDSILISFTVSLIIALLLGIVIKDMSKIENSKSLRFKIKIFSLPLFTVFLIPSMSILIIFGMNYTDNLLGLAQYQEWVLLSVIAPFLSLLYLRKYSPDQKLKKFESYRFIVNHGVMKYSVFVTLFFMVFFSILLESEKTLNLSDEDSTSLLFSIIYMLFMIIPTQRMFNSASKLESSFVFSKAYCLEFVETQLNSNKIKFLNKTLKNYNSFLEKKYGFFINNRLDIVQKYITDKDTFDMLNSNLLSNFETDDHNKPLEFILKEFQTGKTLLKDNYLLDKLKNNAAILSIAVSVVFSLLTTLPILFN